MKTKGKMMWAGLIVAAFGLTTAKAQIIIPAPPLPPHPEVRVAIVAPAPPHIVVAPRPRYYAPPPRPVYHKHYYHHPKPIPYGHYKKGYSKHGGNGKHNGHRH